MKASKPKTTLTTVRIRNRLKKAINLPYDNGTLVVSPTQTVLVYKEKLTSTKLPVGLAYLPV